MGFFGGPGGCIVAPLPPLLERAPEESCRFRGSGGGGFLLVGSGPGEVASCFLKMSSSLLRSPGKLP